MDRHLAAIYLTKGVRVECYRQRTVGEWTRYRGTAMGIPWDGEVLVRYDGDRHDRWISIHDIDILGPLDLLSEV